MGICLTHQITDLWHWSQRCQSYLNTSYYLASLLSLEPQTINLALRLVIVLINAHFYWSKLLHTLYPIVHQCMLFFKCLESIQSSTTHEIIWEANSKRGANVFWAPNETLVQGTNAAKNETSICLNRLMWLMVLDKGEYWVHTCLLFI